MLKIMERKGNYLHMMDDNNNHFFYSYDELIAFRCGALYIQENIWGPTTGKHLNYISTDRNIRMTRDAFQDKYYELFTSKPDTNPILVDDDGRYNIDKGIKTIDLVTKRWYQTVYGNNYFSSQVIINCGLPNCVVLYIPFQYGSGGQDESVACKFFVWLVSL